MITYEPRPGSLADKVIQHLRQHGGVMYPQQICKLWGCKSGNIAHNLAHAINHGLIVREGFARGSIYRLGGQEADPAWAPSAADAEPKEPPLQVVIYGDGEVAVKGHAIGTDDDETAVFTQDQIAFLVSRVARPLVQVA